MKRTQDGKAKTRTANANKGAMWWGGWNITKELIDNMERQRRNTMQRLSAAAYTTHEDVSDEELDYYIEQEKAIRAAR
jgi:capsule polysaccharide export protein KpsC/LpsZ